MFQLIRSFFITLLPIVTLALPVLAQQAPTRGIVNITGQLYRAQNDNHYTVFLVTPEGIIMSDPINRDFSRWLKGELTTRFKVPVRFVIYTHHDWDHASGGVVWADTAEFVGHRRMFEQLALPGGVHALAGGAVKMDANQNGVIEKSEATGDTLQRFGLFDEDRDGLLSGAEMTRGALSDVFPPGVTFTDRHTVTLGGKRVILTHLGNAHAPDSIVLHFPDERAVFSADILQVRRLPGGLAPAVGDWIDALKTILALDFEHALTGHALAGTRKDAEAMLRYLEDISTGVAAGVGAGKTLAEIQKTLTLDAYKGWDRYDMLRTEHIAQIYRTLKGAK
jgi:glyoxylase-like metal-dependent hydrolase (beta-lactamase superfamily II)